MDGTLSVLLALLTAFTVAVVAAVASVPLYGFNGIIGRGPGPVWWVCLFAAAGVIGVLFGRRAWRDLRQDRAVRVWFRGRR